MEKAKATAEPVFTDGTFTSEEIAEALQVDKTIAYGLVRFMEAKNLLKAAGKHKVAGTKGSGATLYKIDVKANELMGDMISLLLDAAEAQ